MPIEILLSLATSTQRCSAALMLAGDESSPILRRDTEAGPGRSGDLLALVQSLLAEAGIPASRIDAIAFDAGPGAFTGLRIGCGVAQGLGFALDRPVLPVSAFDAIDPGPDTARLRLLAIDARMNEIYVAWALDQRGRQGLASVGPAGAAESVFEAAWRVASQGGAPPGPGEVMAVGSGFAAAPALADWAVQRGWSVDASVWPDAARVARRARVIAHSFAGDEAAFASRFAAHRAAPEYVRDKVALDSVE